MRETGFSPSPAPKVIVHIQTRMLTGGAEENTWASCEHQIRQGHEVHLVCGHASRVDYYRARNKQVRIHCIPEMQREISLRRDFDAYRQMKALLRGIRPDIVHTHTSKAGVIGRLAARAAGAPVILHGVHMLPFSNVGLAQRLVYLLAEHAVAPLTDRYIHVSEGTRQAYLEARIGRAKPHAIVRSGMEIARFRTNELPEDVEDLLGASHQDPGRPRVVLMLAALEARKRHEEFIRAFLRELGDREDVVLLLAGDGPEKQSLVNLIDALDANRRVRLLGHRDDPHKLICLADATALSSLREGLPRVVVQSLAGSRPAVVSPIEGIDEILRDGVNGLVVANDSAACVARAAVLLVRDAETLETLRSGAEDTAVDEWTFESMFEQLDRTYAAALDLAKPDFTSPKSGELRSGGERRLASIAMRS
jgi:glycosyltransferase involved in cell wall biosynthesis